MNRAPRAGRLSTRRRSPGRAVGVLTAAVTVLASGIGVLGAPPAGAAVVAARPSSSVPIYLDTHYSFAARAADLVSRMTLPEKVLQLHTNSAPAIPRLGVQAYTYWSEGQHGINLLFGNQQHGTVTGGVHATSFPTNFASTMSWDPQLIYAETTAISDEARGLLDKSLFGTGQNDLGPSADDYGYLTYWAPTVNLDRDPRWGRNDEAFGEDPYLVARMAGAFVDGYQGETITGKPLTPYLKVAATAKHYALNNVEDNRTGISSNTTDVNLRDYYLAQFQSLIENAHVAGVMTSYNAINGTPSVADTYTTNQIAQRTFGFHGYTTSDCNAVATTYNTFPHGHDWAPPGWTTDHQGATSTWTNATTGKQVPGPAGGQAFALRAGTDLNCTGAEDTDANIEAAINAGILSEGVIDNALVHVFTVRMQTGEFDPRAAVSYTNIGKNVIQSPANQALATKVAANSVVLLKNAPVSGTSAPLLPVRAASTNKVVIVGDLANKVTLGGYSGAPSLQVNAVQGITNAVQAANPAASVTFDAAGTSTSATTPAVLSAQTQADIKSADLVIVVVGTDGSSAGEGHDRTSIAMPGNYDSLIDQVSAVGNPRTALMIQSNGPVTIDDVQGKFPAILFSGYNGESQGTALASVIFGQQNPSGHLDFTWYRDDSQLPDKQNYGLTPAETGGLGRTYQYFTGTPSYPFGYGLSYTDFAYSRATFGPRAATPDGTITANADVTNTGTTAGATVAQLYAATPFTVPGVQLPAKRLVGFQKTAVLQPGHTQRVTMRVKLANLGIWDSRHMKSVVYDGNYEFELGANAASIAATGFVTVHGQRTPHLKYVTVQPESVVYRPGATIDLTGRNRWIKDDTNPALEQRNLSVRADHIVEAVNDDGSFADLARTGVLYRSSNNRVASVNSAGVVSTIAPGVATITATVNGVSGSAVIVVKQPLTLAVSAGAFVAPGSTFTARVALPNTGSAPLKNVNLALSVPTGWTAVATTPTSFRTVAAGQTARASWRVSVASDAARGDNQLSATATFSARSGPGTATATTQVSLLYSSFEAALNNPGISDDANPTAGNLDGGGQSYSAQALAAAGLTAGQPVTHDGLTLTWPAAAPGTPDNVVASGQTIAVPVAPGNQLGILGTGDYGTASGAVTLTYTDHTTQTATLSFADWYANAPLAGTDIAATAAYHNQADGKHPHPVSVYYAALPLTAGKTLQDVTLPNVSAGAINGQITMHIFALGVGTGTGPAPAAKAASSTTRPRP